MMIASRVRRLEACDSVTELDALDEAELDELVESAVDACDPDPAAILADVVEDLLGRPAAGLNAEMLDDSPTRPAIAEPLRLKAIERLGAPARVRLGHN